MQSSNAILYIRVRQCSLCKAFNCSRQTDLIFMVIFKKKFYKLSFSIYFVRSCCTHFYPSGDHVRILYTSKSEARRPPSPVCLRIHTQPSHNNTQQKDLRKANNCNTHIVIMVSFSVHLILFLSMVLALSAFQVTTTITCSPTRCGALHLSMAAAAAPMPVTPNQRKLLRKEVAKRRARKTLPQVWIEDGSQERVKGIAETFTSQNELVEVRGISRDNKKAVFAESERLALELGFVTKKSVDLVESKGHASVFYCPVEGNGSIVLRTSFKEDAWEKRPKAPRDNRGQIVQE